MRYLLLFLLVGCTKTVYVPAQCPKAPEIKPVTYRTDSLTAAATSKDTIEAYVLDLTDCREYQSSKNLYLRHIGEFGTITLQIINGELNLAYNCAPL